MPFSHRSLLIFLFIASLPGHDGLAQNTPGQRTQIPATLSSKSVQAERIKGRAPVIDGLLDESVWLQAKPAGGFLQKEPHEGSQPSVSTEFSILYDDDALYIGARMQILHPDSVQATVSRRDNPGTSERILFAIDSYFDHITAYTFGVTAMGTRVDYFHSSDAEYSRDYTFDPVWQAKTHMDSTCWTAEFRIPFSQLRFNEGGDQIWGLNVDRFMPRTNEDLYWVLIPKNETGWSSRFGRITGITSISPKRPIELLPYVAGEATRYGALEEGNPFSKRYSNTGRVGLDMKIGLSNSITMDATIHPDFGQVEADAAEVNLTAFETIYSEKRPFFLEGSQLFQGSGPSYFYSRRIGAPPRGSASGDYVDRPSSTPILGAAKVTGRLASGLSIAALGAVTDKVNADTYDKTSGLYGESMIEPLAGYAVTRLQQEFGTDNSTIGLMVTGLGRDIPGNSSVNSILSRNAFSGGADWNIRFNEGMYSLSGFAGMSRVAGSREAMLRLQRASARYFQRPDAGHVSVDSNSTSLSGYSVASSFSKNSGEHWLYSINGSVESPGFDINDLGRVTEVDNIDASASLTYRENVPGFMHSYSIWSSSSIGWNFGWIRRYVLFDAGADMIWRNFWTSGIEFGSYLQAYPNTLTRGGPLMRSPASGYVNAYLTSSGAAETQWSVSVYGARDELSGWTGSTSASLVVVPNDRMQVRLGLSFNRNMNTQQYVQTTPSGLVSTYGNRYVFGYIQQTTISSNIRLSYSFTPDISLEIYAEPFSASGHYFDLGELAAPGSLHLRRYGTDNTSVQQQSDGSWKVTEQNEEFAIRNLDFNYLSFRSNVVFRWEWTRGSTLYLVWQQNRSAYDPIGDTVTFGRMIDTFSATGDQFIAVKISYWLPV
jgi:hypothetical protein